MPKIETLSSRVERTSQTSRPMQNRVDVSSGFQALGEGVQDLGGAIYKREEQRETANLHKQMAQLQQEYSSKWQETIRNADPADTTVAQSFMEDFKTKIDKLQDGITTQGARRYYDESSVRLNLHFAGTAEAGQAELAGIHAKNAYVESENAFSTALVTDPSAFDANLQQNDAYIDQVVAPAIGKANAETLKIQGRNKLAESAVKGWINVRPEHAIQELNDGRWDSFLTGDQKQVLIGTAEQHINAKRIEGERQRAEMKRRKEESQTAIANDFIARMHKGELSAKDIIESDLDPTGENSKKMFLGWLETASDPSKKIKTDASVMVSLFQRIHLPDGDPNKITREAELNKFFGKGLDSTSLNQLRSEIQGKKTTEGSIEDTMKQNVLKMAQAKLVKKNAMTGMEDPVGLENYQRFLSYFLHEYSQQRQSGKGYKELLDPDSKEYLGRQVWNYQRSQQQIMQDNLKIMRGQVPDGVRSKKAVVPRGEKESAADYLKRTKQGG